MIGHYIVQVIFALTGITALLAAICNWDWFFQTRSAQFLVIQFGRRKARLIYGILGTILIAMSIYFFIATYTALAKINQ